MGLWSVLQTIPIDGSSGKRREFPLSLNFGHLPQRFQVASQGCATISRRYQVSPSRHRRPSLPSKCARFSDFAAFQNGSQKRRHAALCCNRCLSGEGNHVAHVSLGQPLPGNPLPDNRSRTTVNPVTRASILASQPQRSSARGLFRRRGMPFKSRDASRAAEKASCEDHGGASGSV